jgi:hypothetical protein
MRRTITTLLAAAVGTFVVGQAMAAPSIGVNFVGRDNASTTLLRTDSAGVEAQSNWNNIPGEPFSDTSGTLVDSEGTFTKVTLDYAANDSWRTDNGATVTADDKMMKGIHKANPDPDGDPGPTSRMVFTFQDLLAGSTYDVIVYQSHNGAGVLADTTVGTTTYYVTQPDSWAGTYILGEATTEGARTEANYVRFANVSPAGDGTLVITVQKADLAPQVSDGIGVSGIQLIRTSGEWPINDVAPTVTSDPADALSLTGATATFTVAADGPWDVQWQDSADGTTFTDIAGATGLSYTTPALTLADDGKQYRAVVSNNIGSATSAAGTVYVDEDTGPVLTQGIVPFDHFEGLANNNNTPLGDLYPDANYIANTPASSGLNAGIDVPQTDPDIGNFGRVLEFIFRPPTTGQLRLFVRSDDGSEVFISDDATIPAHPLDQIFPVAAEDNCCDPFEEPGAGGPGTEPGYENLWPTSEPIAVTAGQDRGMAFVYKEGGGGDWAQLAYRYEGDTTAANQLTPIAPEYIWGMVNPAGHRAEITAQPEGSEVPELNSAVLSVEVTVLPAGDAFAVQWFKKAPGATAFELIPGANGATYGTPQLLVADSGTEYQAKVYAITGPILSDSAVVTVVPDTTPPTVASAGLINNSGSVGVKFSKPMDATSATDPANYLVNGAAPSAVRLLGRESNIVELTAAGSLTAASVEVSNVQDIPGNVIEATTVEAFVTDMVATELYRSATDPILPGSAVCFGDGGFYVEAGGSDIWGNSDAGHYIYMPWTGSIDMRANVRSLDGTHQWAKCLLMIREYVTEDPNLPDGSRHADVAATRSNPDPTSANGNNQLTWQWRDTTDGGSGSLPGGERITLTSVTQYPNVWIRIVREDATSNVFKSYWSIDGVTWTKHTSDHEIPVDPEGVLPETVLVGIAVTSHDNSETVPLATAVVEDFTVTEWSEVQDPPTLSYSVDASGNIILTFEGTGEVADEVEGPYTDSGLTSPLSITPDEAKKFYRAVW